MKKIINCLSIFGILLIFLGKNWGGKEINGEILIIVVGVYEKLKCEISLNG